MPSYRSCDSRRRPYAARVQLEGVVYWLGYFQRRSEAEQVETEWKQALFNITMEAEHDWRVKHGYPA